MLCSEVTVHLLTSFVHKSSICMCMYITSARGHKLSGHVSCTVILCIHHRCLVYTILCIHHRCLVYTILCIHHRCLVYTILCIHHRCLGICSLAQRHAVRLVLGAPARSGPPPLRSGVCLSRARLTTVCSCLGLDSSMRWTQNTELKQYNTGRAVYGYCFAYYSVQDTCCI